MLCILIYMFLGIKSEDERFWTEFPYAHNFFILIIKASEMLVMLTVCQQTVNITSMTNTYCCVHSVETPDDGQQICPKHVELHNTKIKLRNSASRWLLL